MAGHVAARITPEKVSESASVHETVVASLSITDMLPAASP